MNCKNCGHEILMNGQEAFHPTRNRGIGYPCECGCKKPERRRNPRFCINCGCEVVRRKGQWLHLCIYRALNGRYEQRLTNSNGKCLAHKCFKPITNFT